MAEYFVSAYGNDQNSGACPAEAWFSLGRVNAQHYAPGDRIFFEAQRTYHGTLRLDGRSGGDGQNPVLITSYGGGRAIFQAHEGDAICIEETVGVTVQNVKVRGAGRLSGITSTGIRARGAKNVCIDEVEASDFQMAGVMVCGGCENVRITRVYAHDNGYAGICTGYRDRTRLTNRNIYIAHCKALENAGIPRAAYIGDQSGSGINLFYVENGLVEYCEAARNGGDAYHEDNNGPVGIWLAFCSHVTVQYCISHHNDSYHSDGCGFDFDSGLYRCVFQCNYSYRNKGAGYLLCAWNKSDSHRIRECTLRYCISENDSWHTDHAAGIFIWHGDCLQIDVYNNVVYNEDGRHCVRAHDSCPDIRFFNNIFLLKGSGSFVGSHYDPEKDLDLTFLGNCYHRMTEGATGNGGSLEALRSCGFEMLDGKATGMQADPLLRAPCSGEGLCEPEKLPEMLAYTLLPGSPCQNAGLRLRELYGIDTGDKDFYGKPLPADGSCSIGICTG